MSTSAAPPLLEGSGSREFLTRKVLEALERAFGSEALAQGAMLTAATKPEFGDYQCNAPLSLAKLLKKKPRDVAAALVDALEADAMCDKPEIAGPGFINFTLSEKYLSDQIRAMLVDSDRLGVPQRRPAKRIVVDFSSPNIAKEMHVGHLRSTIIGDSLCRTLEFLGHDVLRLNHVGDWGTQFGMLILYLKEFAAGALQGEQELDLGDLVEFYKKAKKRFDEDDEFKENARREVVALQSGDPESRKAWNMLCDQSRKEFDKIYEILGVRLDERGESFYNPFLPDVIEALEEQKLIEEDSGALCVFLEGFKNREGNRQPLLVRKSDGGFNYATTDLAAIRHRIDVEHASRVLYVTDAGQETHFEQVFQVANRAHFVPEGVSLEHVPFGLVQGEDGKKFKTRSGDTVKLKDLLEEAVTLARSDLLSRLQENNREESDEYIDTVSKIIGISAVKYADLKNNRLSNYKFSYAKMLALEGNTAPYMLVSYARIQGICRKAGIDVSARAAELPILFVDKAEKDLARKVLRLPEVLDELEKDLKPNILCEFIFDLSQQFNKFYEACPVNTAETPELKESRLGLCQLVANTLRLCLSLLGIEVLDRI